MATDPPIDDLRRCLDYCILTGKFWWKYRDDVPREWNTKFAGKEALTATVNEYRSAYRKGRITLNGTRYQISAHRTAWAMTYGYYPITVDHIDHDGLNNCIGNLRDATNAEQNRNLPNDRRNRTGHAGVHWRERWGKYEVVIGLRRETIYLGAYEDFNDAVEARQRAEKYYGFHENHGKRS